MNIILLEDNYSDADLTIRGLENSIPNCKIQHVSTIEQARKLLDVNLSFDIALLDLKLPDGNGLELLIEIRERELNFPVIMLTGSGDEEVAVTALKTGADDYIVKRSGYISELPNTIKIVIASFRELDMYKSELIHVLYIEHHAVDIDLTVRHLARNAPYIHVDAVTTAEKGLSILEKESKISPRYQVVLMDYRLRGMNALELIKALRQKVKLEIPIILVTGQGNEELAVQALKLGANDYLTKGGNYLFRLPSVIVNSHQHCELKRKQEALVESEAKYRLLADNSGDVIFTLDLELNCTYASPAVAQLLGLDQDEAMKQYLSERLTPASLQRALKVFADILSDKSSNPKNPARQWLVELEAIRKDQTTIWTEVKASQILDQNNNPIGILGVTRDISRRKFISDELRKLSRAVEQSPVLIVITDTQGNIEYVNPKFTEITGYTLTEVLGKNTSILKSGNTPAHEYENLWGTIKSGSEWKGEFQNKRKDGSLYWESASITSIKNDEGEITHFLAVKSDITEKKNIFNELVIAKEKAEESNRLKTAFLQNMSHEFRTPMNGILGFIGLLKNPNLTGDDHIKYIEIVEESGQRLLTTINDLIEISKIEAGTVEISLDEVNVGDVLQNMYNFFIPEVKKKELLLDVSSSYVGKSKYVRTDRRKLEGILINLINNALKFTDEGSIEFGCFEEDNCLVFYVKDTGVGIPADKQEVIFDRFIQADLSNTRGYEGSGLGLSISKAYAESLGGKMWLESAENKGTTFYFSIPSHTENSSLLTPPEKETKRAVKFNSKMKILIADDDKISLMLLENILAEYNITTIHVRNGADAVVAFRNIPDFSLILMDIKMPVLDGLEATQMIREFDKNIPIIAQTAFAYSSDKAKALEAGCNDYILKPIVEDDLIELIERYVTQ